MADSQESPDFNVPRHPIQVVARRTGLSLDVIRVWERRYGVVSPHRSSGQRRLYSDADIRKLSLLQRATQAGRRISDLADMEEAELLALLSEDRAYQPGALTADTKTDSAGAQHLEACLLAIEQLDQPALEHTLSEASVSLSVPELLDQVISPIMKQIGKHWEQGTARISHEHLATATIRSFLGHLVATANASGSGPRLLVATPAGQSHEIGALMAAVIAASDEWRVVYLAPNIPARDLAAVVKQQQPVAIVLGITYPSDDAHMVEELRFLRRHIPDNVRLIAGGAAVSGYRAVLKEIGAKTVRKLSEFRDYLRKLREVAGPSRPG